MSREEENAFGVGESLVNVIHLVLLIIGYHSEPEIDDVNEVENPDNILYI